MRVNVEFRGLKELDKFYDDLPFHIQKNVIRSTNVLASQPYRKALKSLASQHVRTGQLVKSIGVRTSKKYKSRSGIPALHVGFISKKGGWYARFVELGTDAYEADEVIFKNDKGHWVNGQKVKERKPLHLHKRAFEQTGTQIINKWGDYFEVAVNRYASRIFRKYA